MQTDHEAKLLQQSCVRALQLLKLYTAVSRINSKPELASPSDPSVDIQVRIFCFMATICTNVKNSIYLFLTCISIFRLRMYLLSFYVILFILFNYTLLRLFLNLNLMISDTVTKYILIDREFCDIFFQVLKNESFLFFDENKISFRNIVKFMF